MKSGVYKITNKINNKIYVGSSVNIKARWDDHIKMLTNSRHHNKHLQSSFNKHKLENFDFIILEICNKEELIIKEQFYIDTLKPEYNILKTAGSRLGQKHSDESKAKMSKSQKGRKVSEETKKKIGEARKAAWKLKALSLSLANRPSP